MRKVIIVLYAFVVSTSVIFADSASIQKSMEKFCIDLGNSVISSSVNQNVYSDAYIGKLVPSIPPHLAVGANCSAVKLDLTGLKNTANEIGASDLDFFGKNFYLPLFTVDARIGGIFLPFDFGASFMKINFKPLGIDYLTFGGDLRIPLLQQGLIAPNIVFGLGYYNTTANFSPMEELSVNLKMNIVSLNLQISKEVFFITPFIGGRYVIHDAEYSYKATKGIYDEKETIKVDFFDNNDFHLFGGLSFDIFIVPITAAVSYDFSNKIFTGICSIRIQL